MVGAEGHEGCGWQYKGNQTISVCKTVPEGNDQTIDYIAPPDYGGYYPSNFDCFGTENGSAYYTDECGCIGGTTGKSDCLKAVEVKQDSLQKYYPCMVSKVLDILRENKIYGKLIQPFDQIRLPNGNLIYVNGLPDLKFNFSSQTYGTGGNYSLGQTQGGSGWSSEIFFNSSAISNSSKLYLQVAAIHETAHAYSRFFIKAGSYGVPVDTTKYSTWALNIVSFDLAAQQLQQANAMDHSNFLESYFDNFVQILKDINGNAYTEKEYQMAAMFGLDNPGSNPDTSPGGITRFNGLKAALQTSYNNLLIKTGITAAQLNTFNDQNLNNVPAAKKLPTHCP